jgi:glutaredoxin 1
MVVDSEKDIVIFGKDNCPHCISAQKLCINNGLTFEYNKLGVDFNEDKVAELAATTGHRTFPYVFSYKFIGGAKELNSHIRSL